MQAIDESSSDTFIVELLPLRRVSGRDSVADVAISASCRVNAYAETVSWYRSNPGTPTIGEWSSAGLQDRCNRVVLVTARLRCTVRKYVQYMQKGRAGGGFEA